MINKLIEVIDVEKICQQGKINGVKVNDMAESLGISRQRLFQFRKYNENMYALDFLKLCEICKINLSDWKDYIKKVDLEKEPTTKREKERIGKRKRRGTSEENK